MSRQRSDYESSRWHLFMQTLKGEKDPFAGRFEMCEDIRPSELTEDDRAEIEKLRTLPVNIEAQREGTLFRKIYKVASVIVCISIIVILLATVANLPVFGDPNNPANNEVAARYIESGIQETGAVNIVTGMILSYRGFDTLGETTVLFIATCCVMILLLVDEKTSERHDLIDETFEPLDDTILRCIATLLFPAILLFGVYILVNGHLSPGGGFSGGSVIGAGLILYLNTFGIKQTQRFFNEHVYDVIKVTALTIYALTIAYHVFTGANGLPNVIPLGTPGMILSSGMILWINLCVGFEVACTMYAFYALFRRGNM